MPFDHALSSRALSDETGRNDLSVAKGDFSSPALVFNGNAKLAGYAINGNMAAPFPQTTVAAQFLAQSMSFVGESAQEDASGGIEVSYPEGTQYGDFAILVLGWDENSSGVFSRPSDWNAIPLTETTSTCGQVWTQRVKNTSDFIINSNGTREGGGYIMHVYRRAEISSFGKNDGNTDPVSFATLSLLTADNFVSLFAVSVGQPNTLESGDVSSPYTALSTIVGESEAGKATMWSAYGQISSVGSYTPPNITPTFESIASHVWASFSYAVKSDVLWHFSISAEFVAPATNSSVVATLTRTATGAFICPFPDILASGVVNKSGREVCLNTDESINRVEFDASINSVSFEPSINRIVIEPLAPNRVC